MVHPDGGGRSLRPRDSRLCALPLRGWRRWADSVCDTKRPSHRRPAGGWLAGDGLSDVVSHRVRRGAERCSSGTRCVPVSWTGRTANEFFLLALVADEGSVRDLSPDLAAVSRLDASVGLIVTAAAEAGHAYHFVSRVFAPQAGIPEDPVTGSAHTVLAPYWADRLGRTSLVGLQVSPRAGRVGVR